MKTTLIAPKGSDVLCQRGHKLCELADDLHAGSINYGELFVNWVGQRPQNGQFVVTCPTCGATAWDQDGPKLVFRPRRSA